jgi:hypothetical protein
MISRNFFDGGHWVFLPKSKWLGTYHGPAGEVPIYSENSAFIRMKEMLLDTKKPVFLSKIGFHADNIFETRRYCVTNNLV